MDEDPEGNGMRRRIRILVGLLVWSGGLGSACWLVTSHIGGDLGQRVAPQLLQYATGSRRCVPLDIDPSLDIRRGDPIFKVTDDGRLEQIGEIQRASGQASVMAILYAQTPLPAHSDQLAWYSTPDSMAWVVSTLLPDAKRRQVAAEIQQAVAAHQQELLEALKPLVESSLDESLAIVEAELPAAIRANRNEIDRIGRRYQRELVHDQLLPLVRREIWPIIRRRAEPTVNRIGGELWKRVSLWRFTWRYVYDKTPLLPNRRMFRNEFHRFVDREALPVLEKHSDEIVRVVEQIIRDSAANPRVQQAARQSGSKLLDDPELRSLLWRIVRQTSVDNPRFRQALETTWTGPEARQLLAQASQKLEPTVRRIGALLIGTPEQGITPEFAAVLRNQVLGKDRRWLVLESQADSNSTPARPLSTRTPLVLTVVRGHRQAERPVVARVDHSDTRPTHNTPSPETDLGQ
jgi:hypothetical protein